MLKTKLTSITIAGVLFAVCFAQLRVAVNTIKAEDASSSADASTSGVVSPDTIFTRQQDSQRQQQLKTLYQVQIEDYGTKVRQFNLNRAQWQSIQTLRSLEEAVIATNAVLLARDKSLLIYFELLLEVLDNTPGIELTLKEVSKSAIVAQIEWLRQHELKTQTSVDRDNVNLRSDEFTAQAAPMLIEARNALMLIRLGQLQTTFDRTNGLYQRIVDRNAAQPGSAIQEVERQRAYAQVDELRAEILAQLRSARESLDPSTAQRGRVEESYSNFINVLETPYGNTSKYLSFLEELARDSW